MSSSQRPKRPEPQGVINFFTRLRQHDWYALDMALNGIEKTKGNLRLAITPDEHGTMPLVIATQEGNEDIINLIKDAIMKIKKQWPEILPINAIGKDKHTPLTRAIENNDLEKVKQLLTKGADPNIEDGFGFSPIVTAFEMSGKNDKWGEMFKLIIEHDKFVKNEDDVLLMDIMMEEFEKSKPKSIEVKTEDLSATVHHIETIDTMAKARDSQKIAKASEATLPEGKKAKPLDARILATMKSVLEALESNDIKVVHNDDQTTKNTGITDEDFMAMIGLDPDPVTVRIAVRADIANHPAAPARQERERGSLAPPPMPAVKAATKHGAVTNNGLEKEESHRAIVKPRN